MREFINNNVKDISIAMESVKSSIANSDSSRRVTYRDINPNLVVHDIYKIKHTINENYRLAFTKFRVSGHSLMCETGRWNRRGRGRLPLEERLCECGDVQTERHVIENCVMTQQIRNAYNFTDLENLFDGTYSPDTTCKIIHEVLSTFS